MGTIEMVLTATPDISVPDPCCSAPSPFIFSRICSQFFCYWFSLWCPRRNSRRDRLDGFRFSYALCKKRIFQIFSRIGNDLGFVAFTCDRFSGSGEATWRMAASVFFILCRIAGGSKSINHLDVHAYRKHSPRTVYPCRIYRMPCHFWSRARNAGTGIPVVLCL